MILEVYEFINHLFICIYSLYSLMHYTILTVLLTVFKINLSIQIYLLPRRLYKKKVS